MEAPGLETTFVEPSGYLLKFAKNSGERYCAPTFLILSPFLCFLCVLCGCSS